jgi:hypothetical protein
VGAKGETLYNLWKCDVNSVANHASLVANKKVLHDGSSSVKMKGNCFIDIDGIYDYHCL